MSAERDVNRIVRSWIREEEHQSADRVLQTVLSRLDTTPQRRHLWPARRFAQMNNLARIGIAAAAILVVTVVGYNLFPKSATSSATVAPSPTQRSTSTPTDAALAFPAPGPLAIGRHAMTRSGVRMSVEVAAPGWGSLSGGFKLTKNLDEAGFIFWSSTPDGAYVDSCAQVMGPRSDDAATLAAAVAAVPDTELVAGPIDVTVGGRPAKEIELRIASEPTCPTALYLWYEDELGGRWASANGDTIIVWIIDVDGTLVWIDAEIRDDSPAGLEEEMRTMVDSIQFE